MCNFCKDHFCECPYAQQVLNWISNTLNINLNISNVANLLDITQEILVSSSQCSHFATIIFVLNNIKQSRNKSKYDNKTTHWRTPVNNIISLVSLSRNASKCTTSASMEEFQILKALKVHIHPILPLILGLNATVMGVALGAPMPVA